MNEAKDTEEWWANLEEWLRDELARGCVAVTFTKRDGTEREMYCTLDPARIPVPLLETTGRSVDLQTGTNKKSPTNIVVYDVEAEGWRSFILKSVKKIELDFQYD